MAKSLVVKKSPKYADGTFGTISKEGVFDALALLGKEGMQLYFYLCINNTDGFKYTLSPTAIKNALGVSESQAKNISSRGYAQLKENGFIQKDKEVEGKEYFLADGSLINRRTKELKVSQ